MTVRSSFAVVDVEGNGQSPPDIVEIAVVPIDDGRIGFPASWLVRPAQPITAIATGIHGIGNSDVAARPAWAEIAHEVEGTLAGRIVVAHNAGVEYRILRTHLPRWDPRQVLDTVKLARKAWPQSKKYGLDDLIVARNIRVPEAMGHRHRALYDAYATARLFLDIADELDGPAQVDKVGGMLRNGPSPDTLW